MFVYQIFIGDEILSNSIMDNYPYIANPYFK